MKRPILIISLLALAIAGCAGHYNVPIIDVASGPPASIQTMPLNAAILITDQMENYTITARDEADLLGSTYTFPLGQIIKKQAFNILSPLFQKTDVVKGKPYPHDSDVVIVPKVEKFALRLPPAGFGRDAVGTVAIAIAVYDKNGKLVWEETTSSSEIHGKKSFMGEKGLLEATGGVAAESVVVALQKAAKGITTSSEIQAFAGTKGRSGGIISRPSAGELSSVSADIDELPAAKAKPVGNAYAIVVGIESYRQRLPRADYAASDARIVSAYLTKVLGYPEENVVVLENERAALGDFVKYFEKWLPNNVEKGGTVFIYYSGHGAPNSKTGDAYLVPYDGDPSFIDETGYSLKRMYASLGKLPAKEIIVALDSCFSGAGGRSVLAKGARPLVMNLQAITAVPKNITILSASAGDQISSTYEEKGHGLFTYFMIKGIKEAQVVRPDGSIAISDLFGYVKPQVERIARKQYNNEQTPQLIEAKVK